VSRSHQRDVRPRRETALKAAVRWAVLTVASSFCGLHFPFVLGTHEAALDIL